MKTNYIFVFYLLFFGSCTYNTIEIGTCDDNTISFSANILPIFEENCMSCHSNGNNNGGLIFNDYNSIVYSIESILYTIQLDEDEYLSMPPTWAGYSKMSQNSINQINTWNEEGLCNN
tara:strand:- start:4148 stop:4501 length:354 start_codon:yes stop_codon:yes gene_type:complete